MKPVTKPRFYKNFASNYLEYFDKHQIPDKQIAVMHALLTHPSLREPPDFDPRLTVQEKQYLFLAAEGKKYREIAACLQLSLKKSSQCRQGIFQKLHCKNISSAIILSLHYGEISSLELITLLQILP